MRRPARRGRGKRTITVWLMKDSVSAEFIKRFTEAFEQQHPATSTWTSRSRSGTASARRSPAPWPARTRPDVIEVGNTQVAQYVDERRGQGPHRQGRRPRRRRLAPGPGRAGQDRRHASTASRGTPPTASSSTTRTSSPRPAINAPPKTRDEWLEVTAKLNKGGNQGIYLPGQNWYTLAGFIWDEGGDLAVKEGGKWKGAPATPRRRWPGWSSTSSSRRSARARRTPTRPSRRRPTSSPRATSPRSSPPPGGAVRSRRPTRS